MFSAGPNVLMAGLVQLSDQLVIQPKDLVSALVFTEDGWRTKLKFRDGSVICTKITIEDIIKALSGATRL